MATARDWLEGARLRTLPAAAAPVFVGAGAAYHMAEFSLPKSLIALVIALALQVGVNLSNDYSDGIRGTDDNRVGPTRLTASGLTKPLVVLRAALACFALAALLGLILVAWSGHWWLLLIGLAAIGAAWFYTGGSRPYGYLGIGLSELSVFVFFGLVATVGTTYVQTGRAPWWLWAAASGIGLISVALLMVNNIRDIQTDEVAQKKTLAVRLGDSWSRRLYALLVLVSVFVGDLAQFGAQTSVVWALLVVLVLGLSSLPGIVAVLSGARGTALLGALRNTGLYALAYGVIMGIVFAVG